MLFLARAQVPEFEANRKMSVSSAGRRWRRRQQRLLWRRGL